MKEERRKWKIRKISLLMAFGDGEQKMSKQMIVHRKKKTKNEKKNTSKFSFLLFWMNISAFFCEISLLCVIKRKEKFPKYISIYLYLPIFFMCLFLYITQIQFNVEVNWNFGMTLQNIIAPLRWMLVILHRNVMIIIIIYPFFCCGGVD